MACESRLKQAISLNHSGNMEWFNEAIYKLNYAPVNQ
jgi:hypothetical protein